MKRRDFIRSLAVTGSLLGSYRIVSSGSPAITAAAEPKSIHTWMSVDEPGVYACDVDIRVNRFPSDPPKQWLYYFALQVNFSGDGEWSHGGIQLANATEFKDSRNLGVNWGGGSDWAGYGGIGRTNTPFEWKKGTWYRYRVWRLDKDQEGLHRWLFSMMDRSTGEEVRYGTVRTRSEHITGALVFTETGYGVGCESETADVEWRSPVFRYPGGTFVPKTGTATYNGECEGASSTQQGLVSRDPLQWFHSTNSRRTTPNNAKLWQ